MKYYTSIDLTVRSVPKRIMRSFLEDVAEDIVRTMFWEDPEYFRETEVSVYFLDEYTFEDMGRFHVNIDYNPTFSSQLYETIKML